MLRGLAGGGRMTQDRSLDGSETPEDAAHHRSTAMRLRSNEYSSFQRERAISDRLG